MMRWGVFADPGAKASEARQSKVKRKKGSAHETEIEVRQGALSARGTEVRGHVMRNAEPPPQSSGSTAPVLP
jgi:hypothetical protein